MKLNLITLPLGIILLNQDTQGEHFTRFESINNIENITCFIQGGKALIRASIAYYVFKIKKEEKIYYVLGRTVYFPEASYHPKLSKFDCRIFETFEALVSELKTDSQGFRSPNFSNDKYCIFLYLGESCLFASNSIYPDAKMENLSFQEKHTLESEFHDFEIVKELVSGSAK